MIVQTQKVRVGKRREKTDPISLEYLEHRLRSGCPLCRAKLKQCNRGEGVFFVCPSDCPADDGNYYYVSANGEKRYEKALDQKTKGRPKFTFTFRSQ